MLPVAVCDSVADLGVALDGHPFASGCARSPIRVAFLVNPVGGLVVFRRP
jgi:hypothetical protein